MEPPSPSASLSPRTTPSRRFTAPPDDAIQAAITAAQGNLLRLQKPDGHWVGELFVDSTLCSDYVAFMHWRGKVNCSPIRAQTCCLVRALAQWA